MRFGLAWHIFLKDLRRLWWMILLTIFLTSRLVNQDSWRSTTFPGTQEGWLNILLPLAWESSHSLWRFWKIRQSANRPAIRN